MAKKEVSNYKYPSRFGSHKTMVVSGPDDKGMVECEDEFGIYSTHQSNLDSGFCDPKRTSQRRLDKLFQGKKEKS